jgi:hypothetical protein
MIFNHPLEVLSNGAFKSYWPETRHGARIEDPEGGYQRRGAAAPVDVSALRHVERGI